MSRFNNNKVYRKLNIQVSKKRIYNQRAKI